MHILICWCFKGRVVEVCVLCFAVGLGVEALYVDWIARWKSLGVVECVSGIEERWNDL